MSAGTSNPARYFGQEVRRARQAANMTLAQFGRAIGYHPGQISRIERGVRPPTEAFAKMCDKVFPERDGWFERFYQEKPAMGRDPAVVPELDRTRAARIDLASMAAVVTVGTAANRAVRACPAQDVPRRD